MSDQKDWGDTLKSLSDKEVKDNPESKLPRFGSVNVSDGWNPRFGNRLTDFELRKESSQENIRRK